MRVTLKLIEEFLELSGKPIQLPEPVVVIAVYLGPEPCPFDDGRPKGTPFSHIKPPRQPEPTYFGVERLCNLFDSDGSVH